MCFFVLIFLLLFAKISMRIVKFRAFSVTKTLAKLEKLLDQPLEDAMDKSSPLVL